MSSVYVSDHYEWQGNVRQCPKCLHINHGAAFTCLNCGVNMDLAAEPHVKISDEKQSFTTGAHRSSSKGKGRYDLLMTCGHALRGLAVVFEEGAEAHGDRNWEEGIPTHSFLNSATRHLNQYSAGERDERHLYQALWNLFAWAETEGRIKDGRLPESLQTIPQP